MAKQSFAENVHLVELVVSGLKSHKDKLSGLGIDEDFITKLEAIRTEAIQLNNEQEKLKAELKTKTDAYTIKSKEMLKLYANVKKRIKVDIPFTLWREFGITDKR
ncbi:membrane-binding protein [Capnocytophaga catalasegens]|uniref:Membrane-binding protein n=1 Tax=Capnocytophaga catalasegens TaxID=1004260 RepID=A0AAV5AXY5_9FLAO|nr:membrane-binding protein [Capnocytophaga catalasegens]GIZ14171.1 hypothetical protein RCZ03_01720 [Capnocytophaga catalasegens]GJM51474.1 hypothetical protein RCZ15_24470 [Capnocytophaga catalasegens]GJM53982.1 hypothetical protein RCZ16_22980 [Capnocytophaga catalasegens]